MTIESKHTAGPWIAASRPSSVVGWPVVGPMGRSICNVSWMPRKAYPDVSDADYSAFNSECEANAALIAEAGTVAHETGLTPRQLAERCERLEAALESIVDLTKPGQTVNVSQAVDIICDVWNAARAAIAKAGGAA